MPLFRSLGARKDATRGTTALEVRKGLEGLFTGPGVLPGAASPLVQGTAGFAYQLNAAHFVTRRATGDGVHLFGNDGPITVATGVAPGSGLSRIDVIWVRHPSAGENGDTDSVPVLGVTQGTAASIPVAPSIPTGALEVARNTMTSAATSTSSSGNTIEQTAARASLASRKIEQQGGASFSGIVAGGVRDVTVTFTSGLFSVPPAIYTSVVGGSGRYSASVESRTATGCVIRVSNRTTVDGAAAAVNWHAILMAPGSVTGTAP